MLTYINFLLIDSELHFDFDFDPDGEPRRLRLQLPFERFCDEWPDCFEEGLGESI